MIRRLDMPLYVMIFVAAGSLTLGTAAVRNCAVSEWMTWFTDIANAIQTPAELLSVLLSGAVHGAPDWLHYGLVFLTYLILLTGFTWIIGSLRAPVDGDASRERMS